MAGMTRRDFIGMAHNYADSFERAAGNAEPGTFGVVWDNMLGFIGIAAMSNPAFDRVKFGQEIADQLRRAYGGRGLALFNRLCHNSHIFGHGRTF